MKELIEQIELMKTSRIENYVLPGVDSFLIGNGKVRLFEMSRFQHDNVTPHSHRFDFACLVLCGHVINRVWREDSSGDEFEISEISYTGEVGKHIQRSIGRKRWSFVNHEYSAGSIYSMNSDEIHSIFFSKGCKVLFFEGPQISDVSHIIEPVVSGIKIPTYKTESWMFRRDQVI